MDAVPFATSPCSVALSTYVRSRLPDHVCPALWTRVLRHEADLPGLLDVGPVGVAASSAIGPVLTPSEVWLPVQAVEDLSHALFVRESPPDPTSMSFAAHVVVSVV